MAAVTQMPLMFLRPRALPRPSTINHFFGAVRASTSVSSATPAASPANPEAKPYRVLLSPSSLHPVYHLKKRGGNMKLTRVKHIEGDIGVLKTDLQKALNVTDDKEVAINQLTRHIIIKGHRGEEVKKFLDENKVTYKNVVKLL